ncbi:hypothetical protein FPZ43_10040 [Mucilaginibacter pallidiroseus]|uniref:Uncharacterized protein n=1 Tax=Mucilaginibacter pallidiroseus TaxID=2599295 RepID=A0A563UD32_9SPHI|nr:hypothetical protein [Mucilaginibacter pallidiroseus]TWR29292.1 hypothetical protein FPZ43_10040 [Mucilaginibacter pallidiroseus]
MKFVIITVVFLIAGFVIWRFLPGLILKGSKSRPSDDKLPTIKRDNDKIIMVENVQHDDLRRALIKFCELYNESDFAALPRLCQISQGKYAVTFPYDIDFMTFCFAVNFLGYPTDIAWAGKVRAWATTKSTDEWVTRESANKKVMLFLAEDDKDYDNVFLTTEDNIGYKLGFASGEEKQMLSTPNERYIKPKVALEDFNTLKFEDFK